MLTKSSDYKRLQKDLKHLYSSFADALNFIEDRAAEEKKDVESGAADERLLAFMREAEPGLQQEELFKQLKDAKSHASKKGVEELRVRSSPLSCAVDARLTLRLPRSPSRLHAAGRSRTPSPRLTTRCKPSTCSRMAS